MAKQSKSFKLGWVEIAVNVHQETYIKDCNHLRQILNAWTSSDEKKCHKF